MVGWEKYMSHEINKISSSELEYRFVVVKHNSDNLSAEFKL